MASFVDGTIFPGSGHSHLAGYPPQVTATRFFIARHGDTDFGVHGLMTDEGGVLTDKGVMQVAAMVQGMVDDPLIRIEAVYSSMLERAIESGEVAGRILGLPNIPVDGLEEYAVGDFIGRPYADPEVAAVLAAWLDGDLDASCPEAEDGHALIARMTTALEQIAAAHPGGQVLVFSHGGVMSLVLPRLSYVRLELVAAHWLPNAVPAVLDLVERVWYLDTWPGSTSKAVI